jgi:putative endopeptidase
MNEIVFPAAILQPPFFDPEASDAQNLGAIGAVIGHEIGHGFDDQGSRYDGHGALTDWWTEEDRARFEEQTRSLIDQFEVLVPRGMGPDDHVNGALTIGENIGDLGGLSIAWKALQLRTQACGEEVTQEDGRTFFEAWARAWQTTMRDEERRRRLTVDPHSPEEFRCNQIVKNMDAFAEVYGTAEGDGMWLAPEERVSIW